MKLRHWLGASIVVLLVLAGGFAVSARRMTASEIGTRIGNGGGMTVAEVENALQGRLPKLESRSDGYYCTVRKASLLRYIFPEDEVTLLFDRDKLLRGILYQRVKGPFELSSTTVILLPKDSK